MTDTRTTVFARTLTAAAALAAAAGFALAQPEVPVYQPGLTQPEKDKHAGKDKGQCEFSDRTAFYDKETVTQLTSWFDSNDYTPSSEAWWRDTTDQAQAPRNDQDGWFGYNAGNETDWFYDYNDPTVFVFIPGDRADMYSYGYRYYDYDNDGTYDAMAAYNDDNADGTFDNIRFVTFSEQNAGEDKQKLSQKSLTDTARQETLTGTVDKTKRVKVRGGSEHLVVSIKPQGQQDMTGEGTAADLGPADQLSSLTIDEGSTITVKGPKAKVGERDLLLASSIELNGQTKEINRSARNINARVLDTHELSINGKDHQIALVEASHQGKMHKVAVDLGPKDQLNMDLQTGQQLQFAGFPVKVEDRPLFIAKSVQNEGRTIHIKRKMDGAKHDKHLDKDLKDLDKDLKDLDKEDTGPDMPDMPGRDDDR